jgi:rhodanese-related sulfurtransferase
VARIKTSNRIVGGTVAIGVALIVGTAGLSWAGPSAQELIAADNAHQHRPDAKEARQIYAAGATFVDVRTDREWDDGHVKGAIHIPVKELDAAAAGKLPDRNLPVVTYCAAGPRAAKGAAILQQLGYKNVTAMTGGYSDWQADGGPVEKSP